MNRRSPFFLLYSPFVFRFQEFRFKANPEHPNTNLNTNREVRTQKRERC